MNAVNPMFNPDVFLNTTVVESNATELLVVSEGEYTAISGGVTADNFRSFDIKKGDRAGQKGYSLDIEWNIEDTGGAIKATIGREPKVRQSIMLEISSDGTLVFGKGRNVSLGRVREALNQNQTGKPWSFSMLGGQIAKVKVKHRLDPATQRTYSEVADVSRIG